MEMADPPPQDLVECVGNVRSGIHRELEIRVGSMCDGKFFPGVSEAVFDQLEKDMIDAPTLVTDNKWDEIVDYFYINMRGGPTRTRVAFDTESMELRSTHIVKMPLQNLVFRRGDDDDACKVSHSRETPLDDPPGTCVPTHVRIKQRKAFRDVRDGHVVWLYELSKTWSGTSRSAVEHLQNVSDPCYEVECELVDEGGGYLARTSDEHVAASLLLKSKMLLGEDPATPLELIDVGVPARPRKRRGVRTLV